jgi:hypothetical protein
MYSKEFLASLAIFSPSCPECKEINRDCLLSLYDITLSIILIKLSNPKINEIHIKNLFNNLN